MTTEPEWASVLRVLYSEGMHLRDWKEPENLQAIREEDTGSEAHQQVIDWKQSVAQNQYNRIQEQTSLSEDTIEEAARWLANYNLISLNKSKMDEEAGYVGPYPMELTEKGFGVAREQDRQYHQEQSEDARVKRQNDVNRAIGFLTLGLVAVTFLHTAIITLNQLPYSNFVIQVALIMDGVITVLVLGGIAWTGVLRREHSTS